MKEAAMDPSGKHDMATGNEQPATKQLHPRIYAIAVGLAAWLVLSVWLFASTSGVTDYLLFIVSGFIVIAVGLPFTLSLVRRSRRATAELDGQRSFHDWAAADFDTSQGCLSGKAAAVQILLPIAAVAFGMTAFGVALHVAEHGL
jgi:hypothetical protein